MYGGEINTIKEKVKFYSASELKETDAIFQLLF